MGGHRLRLIREHNELAWSVWQAEALRRSKKLPPLSRLQQRVAGARRRQPQSWQQMKAIAKLWTASLGGKVATTTQGKS
jgi:hypothetical protein